MDLQFEHTVILAVDGYNVPIEVELRNAEEGYCEEVFEACLYPCVERDEDEAVVGEVQCSVLADQMLRLWGQGEMAEGTRGSGEGRTREGVRRSARISENVTYISLSETS